MAPFALSPGLERFGFTPTNFVGVDKENEMFEIGQRVVCVKPAEAVWFPNTDPELCPKHLPETGGIYTIRDIVMGSDQPDGPHWTKAPGLIGLIFEEIVNDPCFTTNGPGVEQAFHEIDFMPLDERAEAATRRTEVVA